MLALQPTLFIATTMPTRATGAHPIKNTVLVTITPKHIVSDQWKAFHRWRPNSRPRAQSCSCPAPRSIVLLPRFFSHSVEHLAQDPSSVGLARCHCHGALEHPLGEPQKNRHNDNESKPPDQGHYAR